MPTNVLHATPSSLISAASTNATSVKATQGTLYALQAGNTNAAARYVKVYDKASAPVVGTDPPLLTLMVPAGQSVSLPIPSTGISFANGIALATTTGMPPSDTGAVGANDLAINLAYR